MNKSRSIFILQALFAALMLIVMTGDIIGKIEIPLWSFIVAPILWTIFVIKTNKWRFENGI